MLNRMQARTGGEHPPREDSPDLALERDFIDLNKCIGVSSFGRRARVAHPGGHLQRAELHRLPNRGIEADDASGDLVEPGKYRARILDLLRRHFSDHCIVGGR